MRDLRNMKILQKHTVMDEHVKFHLTHNIKNCINLDDDEDHSDFDSSDCFDDHQQNTDRQLLGHCDPDCDHDKIPDTKSEI